MSTKKIILTSKKKAEKVPQVIYVADGSTDSIYYTDLDQAWDDLHENPEDEVVLATYTFNGFKTLKRKLVLE